MFLPVLLALLLAACLEESDSPAEPEKHFRVFEFNEKYIIRGIANLLKEKGHADPKVDAEGGKVSTDFIVQGDLRTKVEAEVKKIGRREREVALVVITEKKTAKGWKPVKILEKVQYDRLFDDMEMQIYRELAKVD